MDSCSFRERYSILKKKKKKNNKRDGKNVQAPKSLNLGREYVYFPFIAAHLLVGFRRRQKR